MTTTTTTMATDGIGTAGGAARAGGAAADGVPSAAALFDRHRGRVWRQTNHLFAVLMVGQWVAGVAFALAWSPVAWSGTARAVHPHVWAAAVLGGLFNLVPAGLAVW